jgi:protein tyrosine phosphatase (PTP) superfamily phosphohydrolase (DUF442 family)
MIPQIPVDWSKDWPRKAAQTVNALINKAVQKDGATIYTAPTISNPPTQAEVQAIADALEAVSTRLK